MSADCSCLLQLSAVRCFEDWQTVGSACLCISLSVGRIHAVGVFHAIHDGHLQTDQALLSELWDQCREEGVQLLLIWWWFKLRIRRFGNIIGLFWECWREPGWGQQSITFLRFYSRVVLVMSWLRTLLNCPEWLYGQICASRPRVIGQVLHACPHQSLLRRCVHFHRSCGYQASAREKSIK